MKVFTANQIKKSTTVKGNEEFYLKRDVISRLNHWEKYLGELREETSFNCLKETYKDMRKMVRLLKHEFNAI